MKLCISLRILRWSHLLQVFSFPFLRRHGQLFTRTEPPYQGFWQEPHVSCYALDPPWPQGTSCAHQVFALLVPLLEALIPNKAKQVTFFIPSGFCSLQSSLRNNSWPLHSKEHLSHGVYHISLQILHLSMVSAHEGRDLLCPFAC